MKEEERLRKLAESKKAKDKNKDDKKTKDKVKLDLKPVPPPPKTKEQLKEEERLRKLAESKLDKKAKDKIKDDKKTKDKVKLDLKPVPPPPKTKEQLKEEERLRKLAESKLDKKAKDKVVIDKKAKNIVLDKKAKDKVVVLDKKAKDKIKLDLKPVPPPPKTKEQLKEEERLRKLAEAKLLKQPKAKIKLDLKPVQKTKAQLQEEERLRRLAKPAPVMHDPAGDLSDDNQLEISPPIPLDDHVVLNVKSRRLAFLRRQCYDFYNGKTWSRSLDEGETVKVLDNTMPREPEKLEHVDTTIKTMKGGRLYTPAAPGTEGQGAQTSILANPNATEETTIQPEPIKVEQLPPEPEDVKASRPFEFESTMRPIFKVGMADALVRTKALPTVELVQEVKVVAKSIGDIVPAGWIPQELKLERTKVLVDGLGVLKCDKPILRDTEFKVKTELPIYPIDTMRSDLPISSQEEDLIRTRFNRFLQMPKTATDELFRTAEKISDPRYNWFVQCQQVADYIRKNYEYDMGRECNPATTDEVQDFLFNRKKGNCTDYASAFVVLTRCIGIPSRVVSGFSPGDSNPATGIQEVRLRHRLVWAEAYIPQFGWVPFDCTPQGVLPAVQRENSYTPEKLAEDLEEKLGMAAAGIQLPSLTEIIGVIVGSIVALILAFVAYKVLSKLYRRWRERLEGRGPEWGLYKKVAKSVKKSTKLARGTSETPTEFIERVQRVVTERKTAGKDAPEALPEALEGFLKTYSAVYFGRQLQEMDSLKFHADQVMQLAKSAKPMDLSGGSNGGSNGSNGGPAKKSKIPRSDAASGALRRR